MVDRREASKVDNRTVKVNISSRSLLREGAAEEATDDKGAVSKAVVVEAPLNRTTQLQVRHHRIQCSKAPTGK